MNHQQTSAGSRTICLMAMLAMAASATGQSVSDPTFSTARLLFDPSGMPKGITYSSVDGLHRFTSRAGVERGFVVPIGTACSHAMPEIAVGTAAHDGGDPVDGLRWLVASPFTRGAGCGLDLRVVQLGETTSVVLADGYVEDLRWTPAGHAVPSHRSNLERASLLSWDAATRVAKLVVQTEGAARVQPATDVAPLMTGGELLECTVTLLAPSAEPEIRDDSRAVTADVVAIGGGKEARALIRNSETWVIARLVDKDDQPFSEAGHFVAYVRGAEGSWRIRRLPSLRLPTCWSCTCTAAGELLVSGIVSPQAGVFAIRRASLHPGRDTAWRVETAPIGAAAIAPDHVSWQLAPGMHPLPWTVDAQGRGFALQ